MYSTFEIDWHKSAQETISVDRDDLPSNMRAFKADDGLTPAVLQHAVDLFVSPVQVVQIEVPKDRKLVVAARSLESLDNEDLIIPHEKLFSQNGALAKYFAQFSECMNQDELQRLQNFSERLLNAPVEKYGKKAVNEFVIFREEATGYQTYGFHSHVWDDKRTPDDSRAFYLSRVLADLNSVFVDRNDLANTALDPNAFEADFNTSQPTLWFGKPGSYLLFATKGHEQGPCFHASPPHQKNRTVPIVNFYVPR